MVRLLSSLVVVACLCTVVVGCGDDPLQPYADIRWKLRCQVMGGCTGYLARDILDYNGADNLRISCQSQARSGGAKEFFFSAYSGSEYGVQLRNASYMGTSGPIGGSSCLGRVHEDGNDWEGACGAAPPSAAIPCQVSDFRIDPMMGVLGKIWCEGMARREDPSALRELTTPDEPLPADHSAAARGVAFNFQNCSGF